MRQCILVLVLIVSWPLMVSQALAQQGISQVQNQLISNIRIEGFVLDDKSQFVRLFRPFRNKYLSVNDVDTILQSLQEIYEQAGYQGLISITYQIKKRNLTFTVSLIR